MKKIAVLIVCCAALAALGPGRASAAASPPIWAGQCGLPASGPIWGDYGWPDLESVFGRPGVVLAVSSGVFPQRMRDAGAATVYFDLYLNKRVGTTTAPADPAGLADKAKTFFDYAVQQSGCPNPVIVENELFGASLVTPWSDANAQYRANVLSFLQHLTWLGAHPILLVNSKPYTGGEALAWWLEVSKYADIVREVYVPANATWKAGSLIGNRTLRQRYRRAIEDFTSIGIAPNRLGLMVSFSSTRGFGGRNGLQPASAWFQVAKWQAFAATTAAADTGLGSIWSWGWAEWNAAEKDPAKPLAACAWLWARSPGLCDAPSTIGASFDASLTDGQIALSTGEQCRVGGRAISALAIKGLQRLTGDRETAFSALFERTVEREHAPVRASDVLAAERAIVARSFGGSRAGYVAALRKAGATVAVARGVIEDELRRATLEARLYAPPPSAAEVQTFYSSYPDLLARTVQSKPAPAWLGGRAVGLALSEVAPERLFSLSVGRKAVVRTAEGAFTVKALDEAVPLGAVPLSRARPAIVAALRRFARASAFEQWTIVRQHSALDETTCVRDDLPAPAAVDLVQYLPFLRLELGLARNRCAFLALEAELRAPESAVSGALRDCSRFSVLWTVWLSRRSRSCPAGRTVCSLASP